jgi:hypothetical protein
MQMRRMSRQRRKVVVLASATASMSGMGPILLRGHHGWQLVWLALMATLLVTVVVQLVRLRRDEGCA